MGEKKGHHLKFDPTFIFMKLKDPPLSANPMLKRDVEDSCSRD